MTSSGSTTARGEGERWSIWPCDHGGVQRESGWISATCAKCGAKPIHVIPAAPAQQRIEELERKVAENGAKLAMRGGRAVPLDDKTHYEEALEARVEELERLLAPGAEYVADNDPPGWEGWLDEVNVALSPKGES